MAPSKVYAFAPTLQPGGLLAQPVTINIPIPPYQMDRIEAKIPAGHNGAVGWSLTMGGQLVIPYVPGTYIVGNNDDLAWDLDGLPNSGAWQFTGYNIGQWPHTVYLRFLVEPVPVPAATTLIIPTSALTSDQQTGA